MSTGRVVIGTRGSDLALVQAAATERALVRAESGLEVLRRVIRTTGDRRTDLALSEVAKAEGTDKGVFIKELEAALKEGEVDIAVHSLKDVPTVLEDGFELAGSLERAPVRDVLVTHTEGGLHGLAGGAVVGTSSVRRARQIEWMRPDLKVADLRGNVPTRLKKLAAGDCDAIVLAEAGLLRLGHRMVAPIDLAGARLWFFPLAEGDFYPAAGQGAIGLEIRSGDERARKVVESVTHAETWVRVRAEREFLRLLDGGCHTPVGVFSVLEDGLLTMKARVFPEEGGKPTTSRAEGTDPMAVAGELFNLLE